LVNGGEKEITKLACHSCLEQESPTKLKDFSSLFEEGGPIFRVRR